MTFKLFKISGQIVNFDDNTITNAPKFVSLPVNSENAFYLTNKPQSEGQLLYTASSWTDNSQYLAAYSSDLGYKNVKPFKLIGSNKNVILKKKK